MKKITYLTIFCICILAIPAHAIETYYCDIMNGVSTPLNKKNKIWNLFKWMHNGVEKTHSINDFQIVIDNENSYIKDLKTSEKTPLILFTNNDEKAELLSIGTVASSIYTIDKQKKQIYQAKNGLVPNKLKSLLKIDLGYQVILHGNCR